ncbi:hypothetical protein [Paracoccus mutanolyticus]|uniref:hypothetical protein n=1 Tax=Paracoccus mutanolyticus TaxID=1499308 RepID=UPI001677CAEB|nr:hypothetical protein [Paracoccus mutanolyticus]
MTRSLSGASGRVIAAIEDGISTREAALSATGWDHDGVRLGRYREPAGPGA